MKNIADMPKKRIRVRGKVCGLCSTYIASLAGVAPVTVRRFLKELGRPAKYSDIRRFIFIHEANRIEKELKQNLGIEFNTSISSLMQ